MNDRHHGRFDGPQRSAAPSSLFGPWTADHILRVVGANGLGVVLIVAGWYQASGVGAVRTQLAWLNLGVAGLFVAAAANGVWILRGRQAVGQAYDELNRSMSMLGVGRRTAPANAVAASELVRVTGTSLYHRRECPCVSGRETIAGDQADHEREGRAPCEVCLV